MPFFRFIQRKAPHRDRTIYTNTLTVRCADGEYTGGPWRERSLARSVCARWAGRGGDLIDHVQQV